MANTHTITVKLEIVELDKDERLKWYRLAEQIQELSNLVWRLWEVYHTMNDSASKLRQLLDADAAWKAAPKKTRGKRPKWNVEPYPALLGKWVYHQAKQEFPDLNSRTLVLAIQKIRQTICTKKQAGSRLKWWQAILLNRSGRASYLHPQPIPFDTANAQLLRADEKGRCWLRVRVDRIARVGKKTATSTPVDFALKTGGKRWDYARHVHRALDGETTLRGSSLFYDWRKKKWFACLVFDVEKQSVPLDESKTAILRPGKTKSNWLIRIGGKTMRIGGRGHYVAHVRKGLLLQRWGRQESYRDAPPRKGRGKNRVLVPVFKLQSRWTNMTKRMNDSLAALTVELCKQHGVGSLIFINGDESRLLASAGKVTDRNDSTAWPWHQCEQIIEQHANRIGLTVTKKQLASARNRNQHSELRPAW